MRRVRLYTSIWGGLIVFALSCSNVWAQATAQISGAARDQSGAVLPGVEVTATQTQTGISRSAITNETGAYILPNLALGSYRLEATLPGFRTFVQTGINLQVDSNPVINLVLEVGQVTEQVEVQANLAQVETRSTAVGSVVENQRILELPLNGRSVTDLITLSGAAVPVTGCRFCGSSNSSWQGGQTISIVGGTIYGNEFTLDGGTHTNMHDGSQMPLPFPDALQEFRVDVAGTSASGARSRSGGVVSSVTKSGTNEYHGDLFEFVRNYKFNARNAFASHRDSLKRNQFGGTFGGPVIQNKLFFFGGYQGTITRSDPGEAFSFVPTPAVLVGDFSALASPACNAGRQITLRAPFVNNRLDPSLFVKPALNVASRLPRGTLDPCGKVQFGYTDQINENQIVGKVDYQVTSKHSIFGRYVATLYDMKSPYSITQNVLATVDEAGRDDLAQSFAVGSTYLISANTVNAFRVAVNRAAVHRVGPDTKLGPKEIGVNSYTSVPGNMALVIQGGPGFFIGSTSYADARFPTTSGGITDDLSLVRQNHQFTFGGSFSAGAHMERAHAASIGTYTFDGSITGLGMADFFLGQLRSLTEGSVTQWSSRAKYVSAYASDVWQPKRAVTLTLGLRWEPNISIDRTEGVHLSHFNLDNYRQGIRSKVYPQAPAGLFFQGDQQWEPGNHATLSDWWNFSPRFGMAWDVNGNGRTSVRGSYGISYEMAGTLGSIYTGSGASYTVNNPSGGFANPWSDFPGGNPFPLDVADPGTFPTQASGTIGGFDRPQPKSQAWNVSIQRQIPEDFLVSASYVGRQTSSIWRTIGLNDPVFVPGVGDANRNCLFNGKVVPYPVNTGTACSTTGNSENRRPLTLQDARSTLGNISLNIDNGNTYYHGLLLSVQRRGSKGVNIGANYTYSHCINDAIRNDARASFVLDADPLTKVLPVEYSHCDSDVRHIFNLTSVASAPNFSNRTLHMLVTGWQMSGIFRRSTGVHYSLAPGTSRALGAVNSDRLNVLLPNMYQDKDGKGVQYLNPNAFALPDIGSGGNLGNGIVEGPPNWSLEVALSRNFQVGEGRRVELRAEAFNVPNSLRREFTLVGGRNRPALSFNSNTFGQLNSSRDPRIIQFALKYVF